MSEKQVYKAIAAVQAAVAKEGIAKDRKNESQNYKFRGIDDVYNVLCQLLSDAGLVILPRVISREQVERVTKSGSALFYTNVMVEYDFVSAADGSIHTARVCGEAMDNGDKSTSKAMSAAYKYACMQTFCIPTEGDNDADSHSYEVGKQAAQKVAEDKLKTMKAATPPAPTKAADTKPSTATTKNFSMLEAFAEIKKKIGDKNYYRILGANGYEKSNQILERDRAVKIYHEMGECLKAMMDEAEVRR